MGKSLFDSIINATKDVANNVKSVLSDISGDNISNVNEEADDIDTLDAFREQKQGYINFRGLEIPDDPDGPFNYEDVDYSQLKDLGTRRGVDVPFMMGTYDELMDYYLDMMQGKHEYDMVKMHELIERSYECSFITKSEFFNLLKIIKN